jgi:putative Holliday junction resolvase
LLPLLDPEQLVLALAPGTRLMGLDLGTKTIGLALSDVTLSVATPLETIRRTKFGADADRLLALVAQHEVGGLVLGLPVNMDGTEGPRAQATRAFARNLLQRADILITVWDERLSTAAVTRAMIDADLSRGRRAELVDKLAAAYILEGFIDWARGAGYAPRG